MKSVQQSRAYNAGINWDIITKSKIIKAEIYCGGDIGVIANGNIVLNNHK